MIKHLIISLLLAVAVITGGAMYYFDTVSYNSNIDLDDYSALAKIQSDYVDVERTDTQSEAETLSGSIQDSTNQLIVQPESSDADSTSLWRGAWNTLKLSYLATDMFTSFLTESGGWLPWAIPRFAYILAFTVIGLLVAFAIVEALLRTKL